MLTLRKRSRGGQRPPVEAVRGRRHGWVRWEEKSPVDIVRSIAGGYNDLPPSTTVLWPKEVFAARAHKKRPSGVLAADNKDTSQIRLVYPIQLHKSPSTYQKYLLTTRTYVRAPARPPACAIQRWLQHAENETIHSTVHLLQAIVKGIQRVNSAAAMRPGWPNLAIYSVSPTRYHLLYVSLATSLLVSDLKTGTLRE